MWHIKPEFSSEMSKKSKVVCIHTNGSTVLSNCNHYTILDPIGHSVEK